MSRPTSTALATALAVCVAWLAPHSEVRGQLAPATTPDADAAPAPLASDGEPAAADGPPETRPEPASDPSSPVSPAPVATPSVAADSPNAVLDGVLPSGLRVIVARDATLPVAAVVLAVELGTEDDPGEQPGLVHALAFQLLQGNRELSPGRATAQVHDGGGLTMLAVGPAQIRYESLVPGSRLPAAIASEAQRLRAPTVNDTVWADSLRWARRAKARNWGAPRAAVAATHDAPGIDHDGRSVGTALTSMSSRAVAQAIATRFRYTRATLTVVAPGPVSDTWTQVEAAFSDLPSAQRSVPPRLTAPLKTHRGSAARTVAIDGAKGATFAWPVQPGPDAQLEAWVWCKALNRQRRGDDETSRARLRCHIDPDPRRTTLTVRASGVDDPEALLAARIARLTEGADDALIKKQADIVLHNDTVALRTPLALARRLAEAATGQGPVGVAVGTALARDRATMTGHDRLRTDPAAPMRFGPHLQSPAAIRLIDAKTKPAPPTPAAPTPAEVGS